MLSPFDSPIGNNLVRMMAETKTGNLVFNQQGQQMSQQGQGQGQGGQQQNANCFAIASNTMRNSLRRVYNDSANNFSIWEVSVYGTYQGQDNYGMNSYYYLSWDSPTQPTSSQKTQYINYFRQKGITGAMQGCTRYTNPGFAELGSSNDWNGWKTYRDTHEGALTGCTDSNAPNYNPNAHTMDNSCQAYISNANYYTKNSSTFSDGYRYEGKIIEKIREMVDGRQYTYITNIVKVCNSSFKCGKTSELESSQIDGVTLTLNSSGTDFSSTQPLTNLQNQIKSALDTRIATLSSAYVPNCELTELSPTVEKTETSCDGRVFETKWTRYTSNCDGSVEKIVCSFYDNGTLVTSDTWLKSSGMTTTEWKNTIPADPQGRTGYGGQSDYLKTLRETYEAGLPIKDISNLYSVYSKGSYPVVGDIDKAQLFVVVKQVIATTDGCGKKTSGSPRFRAYAYTYIYDSDNIDRALYGGIDEATGLPIVSYKGADYAPTATFGPFDDPPTKKELLGIQAKGCTDSNADNYDSNANTDDGSCTYGSGNGSGNGSSMGSGEAVDTQASSLPIWALPVGAVALVALVAMKKT